MTSESIRYSPDLLKLDCARAVENISAVLIGQVLKPFKKRGLVVALSGGVDSSVVAALAVKALGREKVFGLLLPEKDSSPRTLSLSQKIVDHLGIEYDYQDITAVLESLGCYQRRDEAIQTIIPEYDSTYKCKIILPDLADNDSYRLFSVVAESPQGRQIKARLTAPAYLEIVAATNFKQRVRKMLEYYHADRLNYAVAGTPNRLEYDQGFFVKLGDGAADVKPIAHLYKTQVYQLAQYLQLPPEIYKCPPTTDTYSMPQSQTEFYFSVPYKQLDLCLYAKDHGYACEDAARLVGLTAEQVKRIYEDIVHKRRIARYLHAAPVVIEEV